MSAHLDLQPLRYDPSSAKGQNNHLQDVPARAERAPERQTTATQNELTLAQAHQQAPENIFREKISTAPSLREQTQRDMADQKREERSPSSILSQRGSDFHQKQSDPERSPLRTNYEPSQNQGPKEREPISTQAQRTLGTPTDSSLQSRTNHSSQTSAYPYHIPTSTASPMPPITTNTSPTPGTFVTLPVQVQSPSSPATTPNSAPEQAPRLDLERVTNALQSPREPQSSTPTSELANQLARSPIEATQRAGDASLVQPTSAPTAVQLMPATSFLGQALNWVYQNTPDAFWNARNSTEMALPNGLPARAENLSFSPLDPMREKYEREYRISGEIRKDLPIGELLEIGRGNDKEFFFQPKILNGKQFTPGVEPPAGATPTPVVPERDKIFPPQFEGDESFSHSLKKLPFANTPSSVSSSSSDDSSGKKFSLFGASGFGIVAIVLAGAIFALVFMRKGKAAHDSHPQNNAPKQAIHSPH